MFFPFTEVNTYMIKTKNPQPKGGQLGKIIVCHNHLKTFLLKTQICLVAYSTSVRTWRICRLLFINSERIALAACQNLKSQVRLAYQTGVKELLNSEEAARLQHLGDGAGSMISSCPGLYWPAEISNV